MESPPTTTATQAITQSTASTIRGWLRFLWVVKKHKWIVVASAAVALLVSLLAIRTQKTKEYYEATASLMFQQTGGEHQSVFGDDSRDQPPLEELLLSDVILNTTLAKLTDRPPEVASSEGHRAIAQLRRLINISDPGRSKVFDVTCTSKAAGAPAAVVNALVDATLEFLQDTRKNASIELVNRLDEERTELESRLFQRERELLKAKRHCGEIELKKGTETTHPVVERVIHLNQSLIKAQQERVELDVARRALQEAIQSGSDLTPHIQNLTESLGEESIQLDDLGKGQQEKIQQDLRSAEIKLANLSRELGPRHPRVIDLRQRIDINRRELELAKRSQNGRFDEQLGQRLLRLVNQNLAIISQKEAKLRDEYQTAEAEAIKLNDNLATVAIAEREVTILRELHQSLLNRVMNIDISQNESDIRIAMLSEPRNAKKIVAAKRARTVVSFLLIGIACGLGIVYVIDLLDDRYQSPDELAHDVGSRVLALVRELPVRDGSGTDNLQVVQDPRSVESETFRTLRTSLAFADRETDRLGVTSSEPGDGKTTVLSNLAAVYAQAGKKTLLIDCDLRRPGLSKAFDFRRHGGLSEVLREEGDIGELCRARIQPTGQENLEVLPSGPRPADPSELLSGPRLEAVIAWAEVNYDQVLIDCPPALAASDAALIGRLIDGMIFVVQPEKNHRRIVRRAAEEIVSLGAHIQGIVANRIGQKENQGYGYGYGYGYGFGYGYGYGYTERYGEPDDDAESSAETNSPSGTSSAPGQDRGSGRKENRIRLRRAA